MPKTTFTIDPTSEAIVLTFAGGATADDVPARDLHGGDLARIAYGRALWAAPTIRPGPASQAALAAVLSDLVATGAFVTATEPAAPATTGSDA